MKKTLVLVTEQLASNYCSNMLQHLTDCQHDEHPAVFAGDVVQFGRTLGNLVSKDNDVALCAFRQELGAGFTMMMLPDSEFHRLEEWSKDGEDFQVALFREDGSAVGLLSSEYVAW